MVSYDGGPGDLAGAGIPSGFLALMVLGVLAGIGVTYLASSLRGTQPTYRPAQPSGRSAQERLRELQQLRDDGLITTEEYQRRRTGIVDSI